MKVTERLRGEHEILRGHLESLRREGLKPQILQDVEKIRRMGEALRRYLHFHEYFEDLLFYRALRAHPRIDAWYVVDLGHQHEDIELFFRVFEKRLRLPAARGWSRAFEGLRRTLIQHMREEEDRLFPYAERLLSSEELERLNDETLAFHRRYEPGELRRAA